MEETTGDNGKEEGGPKRLETWMSDLPDNLQQVPLHHLTIPGSHNSGSFSITPTSEIAPDEPCLQHSRVIHSLGCAAKRIICNWSKCQSLSCSEQLEIGVRYFDIRVAYNPACDGLSIVHGLYGTDVAEVMNEIRTFLVSHPKEVVFLDFQHFYEMTQQHHHALVHQLVELFGTMLCPFTAKLNTLTLASLWRRGFQVILIYRNPISKIHPFLWPSEYMPNPWPNTVNIKSLLNFLTDNYNAGRPPGKFYVTQGVLTPTPSFVMVHLFNSLENFLVAQANEAVYNWLSDKSAGVNGPNIVMCDFVEMNKGRLVEYVINMNYKLIKPNEDNTPNEKGASH